MTVRGPHDCNKARVTLKIAIHHAVLTRDDTLIGEISFRTKSRRIKMNNQMNSRPGTKSIPGAKVIVVVVFVVCRRRKTWHSHSWNAARLNGELTSGADKRNTIRRDIMLGESQGIRHWRGATNDGAKGNTTSSSSKTDLLENRPSLSALSFYPSDMPG